jgi:hypothetical protein
MVTAWERSGLSQAEFCRRQQISAASFAWWKRRLVALEQRQERAVDGQPGGGGARRAAFVEVGLSQAILAGSAMKPPGPSDAWPGYEIALRNGRVVRVPRDFDANQVVQLVAAVESC